MNNLRKTFMPVIGIVASLMFIGCDSVETELKSPVYKTGLASDVTKNEPLKEQFPRQYATYRKNDESEVMTKYKGSIHFHKNDDVNPLPKGFKYSQPYLKNLWLGYPFMYEYNEARGHTYALEDFVYIDRINRYDPNGGGVLPATCWNCKTPKVEQWAAEYGDDYWKMDVNFFRDKIDVKDESISCGTCHNTSDMTMELYSIPLKDWLARSGQNWDEISINDKRSLACAQCHVEYYFTHPDNGVAAKPVFPWDNGFDPEQIYEYYDTVGAGQGQFVDFVHAASGVKIIKVQHPEYETWINGTHGAAGVSCADCHMPYEKMEGKKASSHWWTSPLKDPDLKACRQCHSDKTADYLRERVHFTQDRTFAQLLKAQEASVRAHEAVRLGNLYDGFKHPDFDELMDQARELTRKGQFFWDYVSAENSVGFHNPSKALDTLMTSMECSERAADLVNLATNGELIELLAGNIKEIVPPILELNRKLQQDGEFLAKNPWTALLPVLPANDIQWDGEERLNP